MHKLIGFALACASVAIAAAPSGVAIRNARIVTVSGPAIEKSTVVIRDGLIEAVGADLKIPPDAWVIDGQGLTVYPGLIDGLSTIGIPDAAPASATPTGRGAAQRPATPAPVPCSPGASATQPAPARGLEDRPATSSWHKAEDLIQIG